MLPWLGGKLGECAGPLAKAAEGFLHERLGDAASEFRGGAPGIVFLCEEILRFLALEHVNDEDERRFIEGSGALLGLLLIDHVGEGAHVARGTVHRVRLGQHGFFDPFAAIDRVLDAPSPKQELMRQVSMAEAEAGGRGPISRVVTRFLTNLALERPELTLVAHFDLTLTLQSPETGEPLEIDLKRAVESTRDQDEGAVENVANRLLSMLPGSAEAEVSLSEARQRLMPRLVRADSLRDLSSSGRTLLASAPLTEELGIALLLEYKGRARYVRESELAAWGATWPEAFEIAWRNLAANSKTSRISRSDTPQGPIFVARTGDGRDSARVVLPALPAELRARIGARVALAIPHRDTFFACDADNPQLVEAMQARAREDAARAPHRLSDRVYLLDERGLNLP
ncbi:MAG: DUF1444 family protein [Myxococcales bacterium]